MPNVTAELLPVEAPDPFMTSIQPGGGVCMQIELAWGRCRRFLLRRLRPAYVRRMQGLRRGSTAGCPIDVIDSRDVKFYRNVCQVRWDGPDPFAWRDRLPFVRVGLAELILLAGGSCGLAAVLWVWSPWAAALALLPAAFCCWFFRDPTRTVPTEPGLVVSPADGHVVAIDEVANDEFVGGRAVMIGIFLSVFDVHVNRAPVESILVGQTYRRGKFLNALRAASARENEQLEHRLQQTMAPYRRMRVRQIAGAIARRIVCWTPPGHRLARGEQFGMIKLGSRTEIVLPREEDFRIEVRIGQQVRAGTTVLARYECDREVQRNDKGSQ